MSEIVVVNPEQFSIEPAKAATMLSGLEIHLTERDLLQAQYNQVVTLEVTKENIKKFKELRIAIKNNRTKGIESWHKTEKEFYLRGGQFIDAIKRKEVLINQHMEEKLETLENFFVRQEEERIAKLKADREAEMSKYDFDFSNIDLGSLDEDSFNAFLIGAKTSYEEKMEAERLEKEQQEKEAADQRLHFHRQNLLMDLRGQMTLEEKEMRYSTLSEKDFEAMRKRLTKAKAEADKELERLRKEQELAEKKLAEEKARAAAEREKFLARSKALQPYITFIRDYDATLALSDEDFEKELKTLNRAAIDQANFIAEQTRKQEEEMRKIQEEKDKAEKALKRQREKEAAELKAKQEEEERLKKAPIKEKLLAWLDTANLEEFKEENDIAKEILDKFNGFKSWAKKQIDNI